MFSKVKTYFIRVVFFSTVVMIGIMLTGAIKRAYTVLDKDATVKIGKASFDLDALASNYLPKIVVPDGIRKDDLESILYEVIAHDSIYTINYFFRWKTETHPSPTQNLLNNIWKFIYFKFNLNDIEYLQVDISRSSGDIKAVKFAKGELPVIPDEPSLHVGGWEHNFMIGNRLASEKYLIQKEPEYLEDSDYAAIKIARRKQGDFKTEDNNTNIPIIIFLGLITTYYFRYLQKDYEPKDAHH